MQNIYLEITKLKALKIFSGALGKSYDEWTEEESRACSMLDSIWRSSHGYSDCADIKDKKHMNLLSTMINSKDFSEWKNGIDEMSGLWLKENKNNSRGFLSKLYDGICKLWDSLKNKFGIKKEDDISPFEAIRTLKITESPKFNNISDLQDEFEKVNKIHQTKRNFVRETLENNEWAGVPEHVREKYQQIFNDIETKRAQEAEKAGLIDIIWDQQQNYDQEMKDAKQNFYKKMIAINPLYKKSFDIIYENRDLSLILYTKTFIKALSKPYSLWTKQERDACSVLDAIWRKDKGKTGTNLLDSQIHWQKLNEKIMNMTANELKYLEDSTNKCCSSAIKNDNDNIVKMTYNRLMSIYENAFAASKNEFSPFEAMRMKKILDDPRVDIQSTMDEIENYALGQAAGSMPKFVSGIVPEQGKENLFGENVPYQVIKSTNYDKLKDCDNDANIKPVQLTIEGKQEKVALFCMSNEKEAIIDAFLLSMGEINVVQKQCEKLADTVCEILKNKNASLDTKFVIGEEHEGYIKLLEQLKQEQSLLNNQQKNDNAAQAEKSSVATADTDDFDDLFAQPGEDTSSDRSDDDDDSSNLPNEDL